MRLTTRDYCAGNEEAILKDRVAQLIHLAVSARSLARREVTARRKALRTMQADILETRLCIASEELHGEPMQDFESCVCAWYRRVH